MEFSKKWFLTVVRGLACLGLLAAGAAAQTLPSGEALVRAMHDRYRNDWYRTLTFTQLSTTYKPDGTTSSEIWREAMMLPGKLRIDIGPATDDNARIFSDGTLTAFRNGQVTSSRPFVHLLLVLGFDVYRQEAQVTMDQLKAEKFDLSKLHEETWEGEAAIVVGADPGDLTSKQFWIEKKRLLFVRLIQPAQQDNSRTSDIRFLDYRRLSAGWVAAKVEMYVNGAKTFSEEYSDIQTNPELSSSMFDPKQFSTK